MSSSGKLVAFLAVAGLALAGGCAGEPDPQTSKLRESSTRSADPSGSGAGKLLDAKSSDGHRLRQVPADGAPSVRLEVRSDPAGGWNLHLITQRFSFTPERTGDEARGGEGHAHLYLDGEKIARVYGPWFHLGGDAVPAGEHTLSVALNANDHTVWAVDGEEVSDRATVTGGQDPDGHEHDHGTEEGHDHGAEDGPDGQDDGDGTDDAGKADVDVVIRIAGGEVSAPDQVQVAKGDVVRIEVRSDSADTIHLHWYDLEEQVRPGRPAVLTFTADSTGRFEVETHESGLLLTQLLVR